MTGTVSTPTLKDVLANPDKIVLFDSDPETGLNLYNYTNCLNSDTDLVKNCRGLVFHKDTLIFKGFPYPTEFNHLEEKEIEEFTGKDLSKYKFFISMEGALLRLFHFGNKWYLTTHRKLDAFKSKWSSRDSFGTLFKRALEFEEQKNLPFAERLKEGKDILERFQNSLDKSHQYLFLLRNTKENRIVSLEPQESEPLVYHVGTVIEGAMNHHSDYIGLAKPIEENFSSVKELCEYVRDIDPQDYQGVIAFGDNHFKVVSKDYQKFAKIRGNVSSVKFRYLQLRCLSDVEDLIYLYPEMERAFQEYEDILVKIGEMIYHAYIDRFIRKQYVTVPKDEYRVIQLCHNWHLQNKQQNKINLKKVLEFLNQSNAVALNHMIKRYRQERQETHQN